ncbi:hypothetical protein BV25DRAFT_1915964 [Artomyces pyxidatus]|uniref:Uncharacterized protein n=1 Tax=Artomyces pyxidatus TaxID=48021 RepID=A0ACB8T114_9AGAM|nr:hypothetical protein BV25DRAFT_1915964 [Artomyces pyxidatus]
MSTGFNLASGSSADSYILQTSIRTADHHRTAPRYGYGFFGRVEPGGIPDSSGADSYYSQTSIRTADQCIATRNDLELVVHGGIRDSSGANSYFFARLRRKRAAARRRRREEFEMLEQQHPSSPANPTKLESLNPTLSSWLANMSRLCDLVEQIQELANSAPPGTRRAILDKVAVLRAAYKKQQERCIDFLQLTQDYADRYLKDIAGEIQSQGAMLRVLEQRLKAAKGLRTDVVDLQRAFKIGTFKGLKSVRKSVRGMSLPDDVKLFTELDTILRAIQACYKDLDKFWIGEVRRVAKALKSCRMEKDDVDRWEEFQKALHEATGMAKDSALDGPSKRLLSSASKTSSDDSSIGLGGIATYMVPAMITARSKLLALQLSPSTMLMKPTRATLVLEAVFNFQLNWEQYLAFLERCILYGDKLISTNTSFILRPVFPLSRSAEDLRMRAQTVMSQAGETCTFVSTADSGEDRTYRRMFRDIGSLLRKICLDWQMLCTGRNTIFAWVTSLDDPDAFRHTYTAKQLSSALRKWAKESELLCTAKTGVGA